MTATEHAPDRPGRQRVGFLGPVGTFTEQAMLQLPELRAAEPVPFTLMTDVLFAVQDGRADLGVVPVENAIEGTVNATVDTMAFDVDVFIQRELVEPVSLNLLVLPGSEVAAVERVVVIPVASSQCRTWLRKHLPSVEFIAANSTAEAARIVASAGDPAMAAIANVRAGEVYGLDTAASDIEDHPENQTRFVVVAPSGIPAPTGHDKTSIVVFQHADRPGSLLAILQEFAARSINLTLLLSRPTKTSLGEYCFLLDLDGHVADPVVADCLRTLRATQGGVKFLGSYPAAGPAGPETRAEVESSFADAEEWLTGIREQIAQPGRPDPA
jgi:prephenate dehydratase